MAKRSKKPSGQTAIDPFTLEIIKDSLVAIGDEMFVTMARTSMSTIIYEVLDYATGLTDAQGNLITQGNGVTLFIGTLTYAVQSVLEKFKPGELNPGDIFITNDPYGGGGTHLSDVSLIMPIFHDGEIVAFAGNKGHWTEVGGKDAGSWTTDATEVYQEGLQFPCVKLFVAGEPIQSLLDLIRANVRTPDMSIGDMYAQAASLRIADRRFRALCDRYGIKTVQKAMASLLDYGETVIRQEMKKVPNGVYEAVDYIDDDGVGNGPFEVKVKITKTDDEFICDFTGTHPQVPGPINCSRTGLNAGARVIFKALTDPAVQTNDGCFRPLTVICPEGTIFTCVRPAAVSTYWETVLYVMDLMWKAMAPVLPARLAAGHFLSVCGTVVSGNHPDSGELFILVEPQAGGWGGGAGKDGENGLVSVADGETYIIPVEVCETRYGVLVDQFALDVTDGGAGQHRGGRGMVRDYRITADEAWVTGTYGRYKFLPWAMKGGLQGSKNYMRMIYKDGREPVEMGKAARFHLKRGDVARLITATGGGYGDPHQRPVAVIQEDVKNGYITLQQAERDYGVVLDPNTLAVIELRR
ncbi:MAG: hydantoinase B/oxoprolinase family protein [Chloroflexi bacterium]|nr:hydantoinase B/oxoprolinase family protein [Chloroflexota bacterium]